MGNIYNLMNGVNMATLVILPMLGRHPDEYPRFRDCFLHEDKIYILTRMGGYNNGFSEEIMLNDPNFIKAVNATQCELLKDTPLESDSTYKIYIFRIPDKWKSMYEHLKKTNEFSNEYIDEIIRVYPKLKDKFEKLKK